MKKKSQKCTLLEVFNNKKIMLTKFLTLKEIL